MNELYHFINERPTAAWRRCTLGWLTGDRHNFYKTSCGLAARLDQLSAENGLLRRPKNG